MKITLEDASVFKEIVNILDSLVHEGKFVFDGEKLRFKALDSANVCLIDLEINKDAFLEAEGEGEFVVKLQDLKDVLKKTKKSDVITLELTDKLNITLKGSFKRRFGIPIIEHFDSEVPEANLDEFKSLTEMDSKIFKEAIETLEAVSYSTKFISDEEKLLLKSEEDLEEVEILFEKTNEAILKHEVKENSSAVYGNDYLKKIIKAYKVSPTVSLQFANSYPLKLEYKNLDKIKLSFILAPKIEE